MFLYPHDRQGIRSLGQQNFRTDVYTVEIELYFSGTNLKIRPCSPNRKMQKAKLLDLVTSAL
jgi:hypothetical protein